MEFDNMKAFIEYKQTHDINLRNKIALNNYKLIYIAIKGLYSPNTHDIEEIVQEAFIALLGAIENFDVDKGFKFSTYACKYIKSITRKIIQYNNDISINHPISNSDNDDLELLDTIEDEKINIEDDLFKKDLKDKITAALERNLDKTEKYILVSHFVDDKTYTTISNDLFIPQYKILKIKNKALKKLEKDPFFIEYKKDFISNNEINYLKAYQFKKRKSKNNDMYSPVWEAVIQRENRSNRMYKEFLSN